MDPELQTLVKLPVVPVHRKEMYAIASVLGVCFLGCACVLAYSFTDCGELERGAQELRFYIASGGAKVSKQQSGGNGKHAADIGGVANATSALPETPATLAARYGGAEVPMANISELSVGSNRRDTSYVGNAADLPVTPSLSVLHGEGEQAAPASKGASAAYTAVDANVN